MSVQLPNFHFSFVSILSSQTSCTSNHYNIAVAFLARKTFVDSDDYEIVEEGYKTGHGHYYMYVFKMKKVIGVCPWGYPRDEICVYFSWKESYGDKFHVITTYPFSRAYHVFLKQRKQGTATF